MIEPEFLASLRRRHRAELVLVLVQLEQLAPGWWLTLQELADQLGTDRATLNRSIRKLEDLGLLRRASISNCGGTWIWWAQRSEDDAPRPEDEPAWVLRDVKRRLQQRVTISERWEWARREGIPRQTMRSFLAGHQRVLRERWELVATPLDCYSV
ncbi:MAG: hypothetical protein RJA63_178 [Pseudomonadota bacterium]